MALTAQRLRELYNYDPLTGQFTRLIKLGVGKPGTVATRTNGGGYARMCVDYKPYVQHRLAWLWMTGEWPAQLVDHINGQRTDNRWANLRLAGQSLNQWNRHKARPDCASGLIGAHTRGNKFFSSLKVRGKTIYLGTFDTAEAAHEAYMREKSIHMREACLV